jgi:DeoR/GlpR family transcriptional regulator of sugar metabolism
MSPSEKERKILSLLAERGTATVTGLSQELGVT